MSKTVMNHTEGFKGVGNVENALKLALRRGRNKNKKEEKESTGRA